MSSFSSTEAALEGLRISRERPWAILAWGGLNLALGLASVVLLIAFAGPKAGMLQTILQAINNGAPVDPAVPAALIQQLAPAYVLILPLVVVVQSIMLCAIYRTVLRPEDLSLGYVKMGWDEVRVAAVSLTMAALGAVLLFVILFTDTFATLVLRGALGPAAGGVVAVIVASASLCGFVWIGVRLSLAAPMTFMSGEVHIFRSWALTRGRSGALLGAYAMALALGLLILYLAMTVFSMLAGAIVLMFGGSLADLTRLFSADVTSIKVYLTPAMLLSQLFGAGLMAVFYTIVLSPPAVAYAALTRD